MNPISDSEINVSNESELMLNLKAVNDWVTMDRERLFFFTRYQVSEKVVFFATKSQKLEGTPRFASLTKKSWRRCSAIAGHWCLPTQASLRLG
jgi:hypothetical protein